MKAAIYIFLCLTLCVSVACGNPIHRQNVQQVRVLQRNVEFDSTYFYGQGGYYSHADNLVAEKDNAILTELKEQNKALRELLEKLTGKVTPTPEPPTPVVPEPEPPVNKLEDKVLKIFKQNCANCHGDKKQDGGLQLIKEGKIADISLNKLVLIHHRTNGVNLKDGLTRMPKGSPALDTDSVEDIRLYMVEKAGK